MSTGTVGTEQEPPMPLTSDRRLKDGRRRVRWQCPTHPDVSAVVTATSAAALQLVGELWTAHIAIDHHEKER